MHPTNTVPISRNDFRARLLSARSQSTKPKLPPLAVFLRGHLAGNMQFDPAKKADELTYKAWRAGYLTTKEKVRQTLWRIQNLTPARMSELTFPDDDFLTSVRLLPVPKSNKLLRFLRDNMSAQATTQLYRESVRLLKLAQDAGLTKSKSERSIRLAIQRLLVWASRPPGPIPTLRW